MSSALFTDLEMSGLNEYLCGICEIGAIDLTNPDRQFNQDCRIDEGDKIINSPFAKKPVLTVLGKTEEQLRDPSKQSQKQLLKNYFDWISESRIRILATQNPRKDVNFLEYKAEKYGLAIPFKHQSIDLHTIAQTIYELLYKEPLIDERGNSKMNLKNILRFCGIPDNREESHTALEDAELGGECCYRFLNGSNLLPKFKSYSVPEILKRNSK